MLSIHTTQGPVTQAKGSSHFHINPYPIVIVGLILSSKKTLMGFRVADKFKPQGEGHVVTGEVFGFNPIDVVFTDEVSAYLKDAGGVLPKYMIDTFAVPVNIRRREYNMADEKSECPAFKKSWDAEVAECKDCAKHYPDEYKACKEACEAKAQPKLATPPVKDTVPVVAPSAPKAHSNFKGFRKGSRAQVLAEYLSTHPSISIAEAAQYIATTCDVSTAKAIENVKGYVWEWKKGMWAGVKKDFPFVITVIEDIIKYEAK